MSVEDGRNWIERKAGSPWTEEGKMYVVSDHFEAAVSFSGGDWKTVYKEAAKKKALSTFLSESGFVEPNAEEETKLLGLVVEEEGPFISPRPSEPVKYLFSMIYDAETGEVDTSDVLLEKNTYDIDSFETIEFASFVEFAKRVEILALKYDEYEQKTRSAGVVYFGPDDDYGNYIFKDEAQALRDLYEQLWENLKKNNVSAKDPFGIIFKAEKGWNEVVIADINKMDESELKILWLNEAAILGLYKIENDTKQFLIKGSGSDFSVSPFNDARRLWLIRTIKDSTGEVSPFLEPSFETSLGGPPGEFSGLSADDIKFGCKSPAFAKGVPQISHDDFVKKYVRPKPDATPEELASQGTGSKHKKLAAALLEWDQFKDDFTAVGDEAQFLKDNLFNINNITREAVKNRRTNISSYVGDYFMGQLPGRPKKVRSLHDAWRYFLSRMDIPILIEEALECIHLDVSIDDIIDSLCDTMLEEVFKIDLAKLDRFAMFLDSGDYVPGANGTPYIDLSSDTEAVIESSPISVADVAYVIRSAIEEQASKSAGKSLESTSLSQETQQSLISALNSEFGTTSWRKLLCGAIIAAPFLLGKGIDAIRDIIRDLNTSNTKQEEKPPIPPFKKCDVTFKSLSEIPIIGTLYDMAIREGKKKVEEEIMDWAENTLVQPVRKFIWSWQKYCIDDEENKDHNYGGIDDFVRSPNDERKMREQFFGDDFDFATFLRSLFAALTPRELCGLVSGEQPSDKVARFVVQFVQTYPNAPQKLKNKVSDEIKVPSFFSALGRYLDTSPCEDILEYPENLFNDPCDDEEFNYAAEAHRQALTNLGLSKEDVRQQVELKKSLVREDLNDAIKKLTENTDRLTEELQNQVKKTAQDNFINSIAGSGAPTGFSIALDTILETVIESFKSDIGKFYDIIANNKPFFEQTYEKILDLIEQKIFGQDISQPLAIYGHDLEHNVSKYHNYDLQVDTDVVSVLPTEDSLSKEIVRQKKLMKRIMDNAGWKLFPKTGTPRDSYGEFIRLAYGEGGEDDDSNSKLEYKTFPHPYRHGNFANTDQYNTQIPPDTMQMTTEMLKDLGIENNFFFGGSTHPESQVWPNMFDPAGILNPKSTNYLPNFTQSELDDLFRIAFRYYARYTYNYNFNPFLNFNYNKNGPGNPKVEGQVLIPKNNPGDEDFDKTVFYGYSSFLIDPVDLTEQEVAEFLDGVDFRCGHRGPGAHPGTKTDMNEFENVIKWSELLNRMNFGEGFYDEDEQFPTSITGLPGAYMQKLIDKNIDVEKIIQETGWGIYNGTGWNVGSSKECLLRLFLFRFLESNLTGNQSNWYEVYSFVDQKARCFIPTTGDIASDALYEPSAQWETSDWSNLIGGHMERARYYYEWGLDFHPGVYHYPYLDSEGNLNFAFSDIQEDSSLDGNIYETSFEEFKFSELAEDTYKSEGFQVAAQGKVDEDTELIEQIDEQQSVAQDKPYYGSELQTEGPFEGQKIPLFRTPRATLTAIFDLADYEELAAVAGNVGYEGTFNFGLLAQLDGEVIDDEETNSYCIIDRYGFVTSFANEHRRFEERDKLIGVEVDLTIPEQAAKYTNDRRGRFKKAVDIIGNTEILGPDVIIPGPSISNTIDVKYALQPQIYEKYLTKKIKDGPVSMRSYGTPETDGFEPTPPAVLLQLLDAMNDKKQSSYQIYGTAFRHLIRHISDLAYREKDALSEILDNQDYTEINFSLDTIKQQAISDYQAMVAELNPFAGDVLPTIEDLLLDIDEEGNGGVMAKVLVKILILQYFTKAIGMTIAFSIKECMEDDIIIEFFAQEIINPIVEFYANNSSISTISMLMENALKLRSLIIKTLREEMGDVIAIFETLYDKQYEDVIDQVILKNEEVYDLARTFNRLVVKEYTSTADDEITNRLGLPEDELQGNPNITKEIRDNNIFCEPRFSSQTNVGLTSVDSQVVNYDNEGFILEKYIKLKFHPRDVIVQNLIEKQGLEETEANELADAIYKLPIEHRGEMYRDKPGKPVYMNVEEFQEVFTEFIFDEHYIGVPDGSVFDWKQVDEIGFQEEFDELVEDPNIYENFGYESDVAMNIQEELALLEQICTLIPDEINVNRIYVDDGPPDGPTVYTTLWQYDPYFAPDEKNPLLYSDLSYKAGHLYPGGIYAGPDGAINGEVIYPDEALYKTLNQVSVEDPRYVDYKDLPETRPFSIQYLEHLNGGQVYRNEDVVSIKQACLTAIENGVITEEEGWAYIALAPLQVNNVFDFIDPYHRKLLSNIAFRYYTIKYFGDYTGFKINDPHLHASNGSEWINKILAGISTTTPPQVWAAGIPQGEYSPGEFFGESKGIATMAFPDDQLRQDISSENKGLLLAQDDPIAKKSGVNNFNWVTGLGSAEMFERYMLFGLFFGFDIGAKWDIIREQIGGDLFTQLNFHGSNSENNLPDGVEPGSFQHWTTSYQRDLFKAMQLYKNGMSELNLPSPLDVFANGTLVTDTLEFAEKASKNALTKPASIYAEEASYGIRLSHLLPQDRSIGSWWQRPLSNFYPMIKNSVNGNDSSFSSDLLTMKRLKAYGVREYLDVQLATGGMQPVYTDAPGILTFLLPLLQEEHEITNSKTLYQLLQENWHEKTNWKQDDRSNHLSLYNEMKKRDEFRLLFDYVFPVKRILSIVTLHNFLSLDGIINKSDQAGQQEDIFKGTIDLISLLSTTKKS